MEFKPILKNFPLGANVTLINTVYIRPQKMKDESGKEYYTDDYLYLIYRNLDDNKKYHELIAKPKYTYFLTNEGVSFGTNQLFTEKSNVHPITCTYRELKKSIAEKTNNLEWFKENLRTNNYRLNDKLLQLPCVFLSDMNIEDHYRFWFSLQYRNEAYTPTKLFFDIETDIINIKGDFPEPGECPVNAITLVDDSGCTVYTLLLDNYNNPQIHEFIKTENLSGKVKEFIQQHVGGWKEEIRYGLDKFKYKIALFDEEIKLIKAAFDIINMVNADFTLAWNIAFDLPFLIHRIYKLGFNAADIICPRDYEIKYADYYIDKRSKKFEQRGDYPIIACNTVYMDQLILFASRRKGQRAVGSYKLDYIGSTIANVRKLDYSHITTNLAELPYKDYHTFVFYNIADTIVQLCIERKINDVDFVFNKAINVNTRYSKIHRQTTYLINRGVHDFYLDGYIMGPNLNKSNGKEEDEDDDDDKFSGAFVADPNLVSDKAKIKINGIPINVVPNVVDEDFKALYPSIIHQNNMAPNTMHGKVFFPEQLDPKEDRFNNENFNRSIWFMEDLLSGDVIDFCVRYLSMAGYEELYDDIVRYYTTVANAYNGLFIANLLTHKRYMISNIVDNTKKRPMMELVDNTKKRELMTIQEDMPRWNQD